MAAETVAPTAGAASETWHRLDVVATVLVVLPIVVAAVRAAAGPWMPIGDDAYFTLRSLDVGTSHHPLVGAWSSGSIGIDRQINNLGPLQLDLMAPFTRLAPYGGTAVAVAAVNVAAVITTAWLLRRLAGRRAVVVGMVPIALLVWTLGSEMLITPRQHQFLLLSYLCFLVACWAAVAGDRWAMVPAVAAASLLTQTHLSYPILVVAVGAVAVAGQVIAWRAADDRSRFLWPWTISIVLAVVLWVQTVVDQLAGMGNLGDVLASPGAGEQPALSRALSIVGATLLHPATHVRRGYAEFDPEPLRGAVAGSLTVVMIVVLLAGAAVAWRGNHRRAAAGLSVGCVAVFAAVVDASQLPITVFGLIASNYRWLWPTATFLLVGAVVAVASSTFVSERLDRRVVPAVSIAAIAALGVASLPTSLQVPDPARYAGDQIAVAALVDQIARLDVEGPVVIDESNLYFGHPYGYPTALALTQRGLDYRFPSAMQERRFGAERVADGSEPTILVLWFGDDAVRRAADATAAAYVSADPPVAITVVTR